MTTKLISREPTEEMLEANRKAYLTGDLIWQAMFDAAPSLNPWVSVKERLPEESGDYLCRANIRNHIGWGFFRKRDPVSHKARFISGTGREITHWWDTDIMPIPRPEED